MRNSIFNLATAAFVILFLGTFSSVSAQCPDQVLKTRNGTVMAGGPAKTTVRPTTNEITVAVTKTSGRAQTIVNIYVDNQLRRSSTITYQNGNYSGASTRETRVIRGVRNRSVRIDIINQSVGNRFGYNLRVTAPAGNNLGSDAGNLAGQGQKTITFTRACRNNVTITVRRTGGNAKANVTFYRNNRRLTDRDHIFDRNENLIRETFNNANGSTYKVVIKNVSVGNFIRWSASATQQ